MVKVCHVTSAHGVEDDRIFLKECISLAQNNYVVYLVERGSTYDKDGVHIIGLGEVPEGRLKRIIKEARKAYQSAILIDADIYHLHDPELLRYALKLKRKGKTVIFDSHEDVPAQILDKTWIPKPFRVLISRLYKTYETHVVKRIDAVVAATPHIAEQFVGSAKKIVTINNYPKLDDIQFQTKPFVERKLVVCYAGGIDDLRGEHIMIDAMKNAEEILVVAGDHAVEDII